MLEGRKYPHKTDAKDRINEILKKDREMENIEIDKIASFLKLCLSVFPITVLHPVLTLFEHKIKHFSCSLCLTLRWMLF